MSPAETSLTVLSAVGSYAVAAGLLTLLPGPDTVVVIATAVNAGRAAAVRAAFGIAAGLLLWGAAASIGIAAVLRASTEVYTVFKVVCIAYLLWLAVGALRGAFRRGATAEIPHDQARGLRAKLPWGFRQAFLTAAMNPKLGVFFVAFLPQFIPPGTSIVGMTMLFSSIQACEALLWFLLMGCLASIAQRWLSRRRVRRAMGGATGAVFLFFAARLVLERP